MSDTTASSRRKVDSPRASAISYPNYDSGAEFVPLPARRLSGHDLHAVFGPSRTAATMGGIEWARLTEVEYAWPCAFNHIEKQRADDVFKALKLQRRRIEVEAELRQARFAVKLAGEANPRPVLIHRPDVAGCGRGEEAALIDRWRRARGFVLVGSVADDEESQSLMAAA